MLFRLGFCLLLFCFSALASENDNLDLCLALKLTNRTLSEIQPQIEQISLLERSMQSSYNEKKSDYLQCQLQGTLDKCEVILRSDFKSNLRRRYTELNEITNLRKQLEKELKRLQLIKEKLMKEDYLVICDE